MPQNPLEKSQPKPLEKNRSRSDIQPSPNVIQEAAEAALLKKRSNSIPYRYLTEDFSVIEESFEVKSPSKQGDQSSKEPGNVKDVRSTQPVSREQSRDTLTDHQRRIYDRLPPEHQANSELKNVLYLSGKRENDKKDVADAKRLVEHFESFEDKVDKEIDRFTKELKGLLEKEGNKKVSHLAEELNALFTRKNKKVSEGQAAVSLLEALRLAEETGYGKADQSKDMLTRASMDIYQISADAKEARGIYSGQLSRMERHLHTSQGAYEKAKKALPRPQREALSKAEAEVAREVRPEEKKSDSTRDAALEQKREAKLNAMREHLDEGIAAAKRLLSEA